MKIPNSISDTLLWKGCPQSRLVLLLRGHDDLVRRRCLLDAYVPIRLRDVVDQHHQTVGARLLDIGRQRERDRDHDVLAGHHMRWTTNTEIPADLGYGVADLIGTDRHRLAAQALELHSERVVLIRLRPRNRDDERDAETDRARYLHEVDAVPTAAVDEQLAFGHGRVVGHDQLDVHGAHTSRRGRPSRLAGRLAYLARQELDDAGELDLGRLGRTGHLHAERD